MDSVQPHLHNQSTETEQLINGMMSFLDESTEIYKSEEVDGSKNPLCTGIKTIIGMFPAPPPPRLPFPNFNSNFQTQRESRKPFFGNSRMESGHCEKACRYKDPYIQEVNRLMFCSTMGHPPNGSQEYFKAAEKYAVHGKDFLDFPTEIKFPRPTELGCFDGDVVTQLPSPFQKPIAPAGLGVQLGKHPSLGNSSGLQLPVMVNHSNYWGYPFYQTPNLVQPLMYSNPFLMTQYLNMFVREMQVNTSIVQQHQFLSGCVGGIQERLVYAQLLQHQIQTNYQATQGGFVSHIGHVESGVGKTKAKLQDVKKSDEFNRNYCDGSSDFMRTNANGTYLHANNAELDI